VIALPVLRKLRDRLIVTIPVESNCGQSLSRYTPFFPKLEERIRAITALRRFGITVNVQVGPLLPYGDIKTEAASFARFLSQHADYIHVTEASSHLSERDEIAKTLAEDGRWEYLRKGCSRFLLKELESLAPEKLKTPDKLRYHNRQLSLFAA
jgi:DNA repair photolyase